MLENFHFLRPLWLLLFLPLSILFWYLRSIPATQKSTFCEARFLPFLLPYHSPSRYPLSYFILFAFLSVIALAGPSWNKKDTALYEDKESVVILLDLSYSMLAQDIAPSRLIHAKHKITDIIQQYPQKHIALLVYAGDSHLVIPPTPDGNTIQNILHVLHPDIMPVKGSAPEYALQEAKTLLEDNLIHSAQLLLFTDGIYNDKAYSVAEDIAAAGHQLSVLGFGTLSGSTIPLKNNTYYVDQYNQKVITQLTETTLQELASLGGGKYVRSRYDDQDLQTIFAHTLKGQGTQQAQLNHQSLWHDQGFWLVLVLIPLFLFGAKQGWLMVLLLLPYSIPDTSYAGMWDSLWLNADQQGYQALQQQRPKQAAKLFKNKAWKASAWYQAKDYQQALHYFSQAHLSLNKADQYYNQGNSLAQLQRYQKAIDAYQKALQLNPAMQDAKDNLQLIQQLLTQSPPRSRSNKLPSSSSPQVATQAKKQYDESQQAMEQWLKHIPDDPGGLLRRKFKRKTQHSSIAIENQAHTW